MMHLFTVKRLAAATALACLLPSLNTAVANNEVTLDFKGFLRVGTLELLLTKSGSTPNFHVKSNIQGVDEKLVRKWLTYPGAEGAWEDAAGNNLLPNVSVSTNGSLKFKYRIGDCVTAGQTDDVRDTNIPGRLPRPQNEKYHASPAAPVASQVYFKDSHNSLPITEMEEIATGTGSDKVDRTKLGTINFSNKREPVFFECSASSVGRYSVNKVYWQGKEGDHKLDGSLYLGMAAYSAGDRNDINPDDGAGPDRIAFIDPKDSSGPQGSHPISYMDGSYIVVTKAKSGVSNRKTSPFPWHPWEVITVVTDHPAFLHPDADHPIKSMATHTADWKIGAGKFNKEVAEKLSAYLYVMENGQKKVKAAKR